MVYDIFLSLTKVFIRILAIFGFFMFIPFLDFKEEY